MKINELSKGRKTVVKLILALLALSVLLGIFVGAANAVTVLGTRDRIISAEQAKYLSEVDCIGILGCQVRPDRTPSMMLYDRIDMGVRLYKDGVSNRLLMSGDHETDSYNETGVMREYAVMLGADNKDIGEDRYGLCTYDSIFRAVRLYGYDKILIVTQEYHLYRALYIADSFGIEAYGVSASINEYGGQVKRDIRELAARTKDFVMCIFKPNSEYTDL